MNEECRLRSQTPLFANDDSRQDGLCCLSRVSSKGPFVGEDWPGGRSKETDETIFNPDLIPSNNSSKFLSYLIWNSKMWSNLILGNTIYLITLVHPLNLYGSCNLKIQVDPKNQARSTLGELYCFSFKVLHISNQMVP